MNYKNPMCSDHKIEIAALNPIHFWRLLAAIEQNIFLHNCIYRFAIQGPEWTHLIHLNENTLSMSGDIIKIPLTSTCVIFGFSNHIKDLTCFNVRQKSVSECDSFQVYYHRLFSWEEQRVLALILYEWHKMIELEKYNKW